MQESIGGQLQSALTQVWSYLPTLLAAIGVLVLGWVVALIIGRLVRGTVQRIRFEKTVGGWLRGDHAVEPVDVAAASGRMAFWFSMLFVLVAFFQILKLTQVTEPLNALLSQVGEFAPRLFGAALLLMLAWIIASALRRVVRLSLQKAGFDERLGLDAPEAGVSRPISRTVADVVYWVVFLLFLPGVLGALSVEGMMAPLQSASQQVLEFVPRIVGAALILTIGWFVARFVRDIVANLLAAMGADRLGTRAGVAQVPGVGELSKLAGLVAYILILIPVVLASLNALELNAITAPASSMLENILGAVPKVFAATLLLGLAYVVGRLISDLVASLLSGAGFDRLLDRLGLFKDTLASTIVAKVALVAVMLFAAMEASSVMGFVAMTELIQGVAVFGGQLILALMIVGLGLYFAGLAQEAIRATAHPVSATLGTAARIGVIAVAGAMALQQLNVGSDLITVAFAAVMGGTAVAAAIAFGLGGRETAHEYLQTWTHRASDPARGQKRSRSRAEEVSN